MITPLLQHDAFLADVAAARADTSRPHLWWLGQSGYLVQFRGKHLLIDPYLSDSLTKKYAATDKPHVRMSEIVVDPARLDFIDVVSSSHNHTDHLDAATLIPIRLAKDVEVVVPDANRMFAAERVGYAPGCLIMGMDDGVTREVGGFTFHGVPAAHETIERDAQGRLKYMGYVIEMGGEATPPRAVTSQRAVTSSCTASEPHGAGEGARSADAAAKKQQRISSAASTESKRWRIYHSGDTILFDGMVERLRPFNVDLALLPINGRAPERRTAGNLWGREAAQLAHDIGAKLVVPCHYDMFEFNTATTDEFVAECRRVGQPYRVLRQGERLDL